MATIDAGGVAVAEGETVGEGADRADEGRRGEGERRPRNRGGRERQRRERNVDESGAAIASDERPEGALDGAAERRPSPAEVARFEPGPRAVSIGEENAEAPVEASSLGTSALAAMPDVSPTGVAPQPVELPSPAPQAAPEPFVLPLGTLEAIAEGAGLQWVNSDAEKIRAAREAMAREPAPIHVPRERKPVQRVNEGPLVLVETRKDLSQIKLPFEAAPQEAQESTDRSGH